VQRSPGRVVVGTDFSEGALRALADGRWLARRAGLELQVLHVLEPGSPPPPEWQAREWLAATSLDPALLISRQGRPWIEIVRHAHEVSASIIVLGTHGQSGFQAMSLGTTASRVALRASCPVLFTARATAALSATQTDTPYSHPSWEQP